MPEADIRQELIPPAEPGSRARDRGTNSFTHPRMLVATACAGVVKSPTRAAPAAGKEEIDG